MSGNQKPGAFVAARLSILAAECADSERFGRGRRYFKEDAVLSVEITQGTVSASVQGSDREPYSVRLRWQPVFRPGPVPVREELSISCACLDLAPVCKHAVAVLLKVADDVGRDPAVLDRWRGPDSVWEHLPVRPLLSVVPPAADAPARRLRDAAAAAPPVEPSLLEPFFGSRASLWAGWEDDDNPFPGIVPLAPEPRSTAAEPLAAAAGALLDEALAVLTSVFG